MRDDDLTRNSGFGRAANPDDLSRPRPDWQIALSEGAVEAADLSDLDALSLRYSELTRAGSGGMGVVFKARDLETSEFVALKVLKKTIASDEQDMERFKNKLRLARRVTHKNVCRVYEFHRMGKLACISMEYVQGESLRARLNRSGRVARSEALSIAVQVCSGLPDDELHRKGHAVGCCYDDLTFRKNDRGRN